MRYVFFTGAPGSKWSSVAASLYRSGHADKSDDRPENTYKNPTSGNVMHVGTYWDPDNKEFGPLMNEMSDHTRLDHEKYFNAPFTNPDGRFKIVRSHVMSKHLDYVAENWRYEPIVMVVQRTVEDSIDWWHKCGGYDITYPTYDWYKANDNIEEEIRTQHTSILNFVRTHRTTYVRDLYELCDALGLERPEENFTYNENIMVFVYMNAMMDFFLNNWNGGVPKFKQSGEAIYSRYPADAKILDAGCGRNYFKETYPNLIGIDPTFEEADLRVSIEDYSTDEKFDAILCLGSLHFGDKETIFKQVQKLLSMLAPGGEMFLRVNKGDYNDIGYYYDCNIPLLAWSKEIIEEFSQQLGLEVSEFVENDQKRYVFVWKRIGE